MSALSRTRPNQQPGWNFIRIARPSQWTDLTLQALECHRKTDLFHPTIELLHLEEALLYMLLVRRHLCTGHRHRCTKQVPELLTMAAWLLHTMVHVLLDKPELGILTWLTRLRGLTTSRCIPWMKPALVQDIIPALPATKQEVRTLRRHLVLPCTDLITRIHHTSPVRVPQAFREVLMVLHRVPVAAITHLLVGLLCMRHLLFSTVLWLLVRDSESSFL